MQSFETGWDDKSDKEEGEYVEESNTPENLLCGLGESLSWVVGFSSCESYKLGSSEGEGCSDEDRAKSVESVLECLLRSMPILCANVSSVMKVKSKTSVTV